MLADRPKPKNDDELGMIWWNALTERERRQWSRIAGDTGIARDAWQAFKRAQVDISMISRLS
jgi:hypothetical protein